MVPPSRGPQCFQIGLFPGLRWKPPKRYPNSPKSWTGMALLGYFPNTTQLSQRYQTLKSIQKLFPTKMFHYKFNQKFLGTAFASMALRWAEHGLTELEECVPNAPCLYWIRLDFWSACPKLWALHPVPSRYSNLRFLQASLSIALGCLIAVRLHGNWRHLAGEDYLGNLGGASHLVGGL